MLGAGQAAVGDVYGGAGGPGLPTNITGTVLYFAGGGGGAGWTEPSGAGGIGGGGSGGVGLNTNNAGAPGGSSLNPGTQGISCSGTCSPNGGAGGANTGSGGGGSGQRDYQGYSGVGGSGGSGIVIVRYPAIYRPATISGTVTSLLVGDRRIYMFLTSGTVIF
eukprot:m.33907 g.33907  ORF g.33907 m.33907 type:complete len:163 (-) comp5152_c0_seq1:3715-4203(-)